MTPPELISAWVPEIRGFRVIRVNKKSPHRTTKVPLRELFNRYSTAN
ncbi:MAG: hypothetical protein JWN15_3805 [Firmicutes bacterium]|nr:hypothetical protein [Bacillota bacterium]